MQNAYDRSRSIRPCFTSRRCRCRALVCGFVAHGHARGLGRRFVLGHCLSGLHSYLRVPGLRVSCAAVALGACALCVAVCRNVGSQRRARQPLAVGLGIVRGYRAAWCPCQHACISPERWIPGRYGLNESRREPTKNICAKTLRLRRRQRATQVISPDCRKDEHRLSNNACTVRSVRVLGA